MIGQTLAHYRVTAKLGEGGMGEVYRARDAKLGREVAIKVLPAAFAHDPERLGRFQREAQLLASLNHPNIGAIHGLEEANGVRFLVLELVPGETLAERLASGPLPRDEAVRVCRQIAEALEAAHEKGIIHRDLKPGNVKVTPEGKVKVLDFGLAKAFESEAAAAADLSKSPTLSSPATQRGVLLGTAAYMSPEQARGKPLDKRTDIWSFGCVLYETLTARQVFKGETVTDTIAAIVKEEPDWRALPADTPAHLQALLRRCLQKDPARRLHDIADARLELEEAAGAEAALAATLRAAGAAPKPAWRRALPWGLGLLLGVILASFTLWVLRLPVPAPPPARLAIPLPLNEALWIRVGLSVTFSPDGTRLVYVSSRGGSTQLYLRAMDQFEAAPIPGTEGAEGPFFSPDGEWVGFFADHKLKKVAIRGGAPLPLASAPVCLGASWGPDDTIVFAASPDAGLLRVSAMGGTPQVLTTPQFATGESGHFWPEILPGGKAVLYTVVTTSGDARIAVLRLDTGEAQTLVEGGINGHYAPTGHLVFARGGTLVAAPFDLARLRITGPAIPVLDGVLTTIFAGAQFSFSREGSLVYIPGGVRALERTLVWVDRKGVATPLPAPSRPYMDPRLSPDGRQLVLEIYEGTKGDVWVYELARGTLTRLTFEGFENETPLWAPDGNRVAFTSSRSGPPMSVFWKRADNSAPEERLLVAEHHQHLSGFSPDGRLLALTDYDPISGGDIWLIPLGRQSKPWPLLKTPFNEWGAVFSPDGRWLAYVSNESGRDEIYVQAFPGPGQRWQISAEGGTEPLWSRDGRELFYRNGDKMMAVDVTTQPTFAAGKPTLLFEARYARGLTLGHTNYDVSPDGRRFLMLKASGQEAEPTQISVVLNWFEELKRRAAPAKK